MTQACFAYIGLSTTLVSVLRWPMVVLVLGLVIVFVVRRELKGLIQRTQRIHAPGVGLEATLPQLQAPARAEGLTSPPATREPDQLAPAPPDVVATGDVEAASRFSRAYDLLESGKYAEGISLIEEEARTKPDVAQQIDLIAFGQHLAAVRGSKAALDDLRRTAEAHRGVFGAHFWFGMTLDILGMEEDGRAEFLQAYNTATSDGERANALVLRAGDRRPDPGETAAVVGELLDGSRTLKEHQALSRIYAHAAKLLLESEPPDCDRSFALYELAVALAPTDNTLRFDVAYAYSKKDAHAAAFL